MEYSDQCNHPGESLENNELALIAAVCLALNSPNPHRRSPAYAVQLAFEETRRVGESFLQWIPRFLEMSGEEYCVGWQWQENVWTCSKDLSIRGMSIAKDCVYWMQRHWDFTLHQSDDRYDGGMGLPHDIEAEVKPGMIEHEVINFMLPAHGEMVRRTWKCAANGKTRMLDIWESLIPGRYYYAIREEGNGELLARCWTPCYSRELKLLVDTELIPESASEPFIVKAKNRLKTIGTET